MMVCSPISTCAKNVVHLKGRMTSSLCSVISRGPSSPCCYCFYSGPKTKYTDLSISNTTSGSPTIGYQAVQAGFFSSSWQSGKFQSLTITESSSDIGKQQRQLEISWAGQSMKLRLLLPKRGTLRKLKCLIGPISRSQASSGFGFLVCYSSPEPVHAEAAETEEDKEDDCESSHCKFSHGKKVYSDYSVIGIPGDGRCMFRSVAHGACLRSGKSAPNEHVQRELADDLRAKVADEFIKRRKETEWFIEGDFDTYVSQIRNPHVWGGEPELFMASHVLRMPITVYMHDNDAGSLIAIAEYGQEYGKENPIRVLYDGFGHYDALQIPGTKPGKSKALALASDSDCE